MVTFLRVIPPKNYKNFSSPPYTLLALPIIDLVNLTTWIEEYNLSSSWYFLQAIVTCYFISLKPNYLQPVFFPLMRQSKSFTHYYIVTKYTNIFFQYCFPS